MHPRDSSSEGGYRTVVFASSGQNRPGTPKHKGKFAPGVL